MRTRVIAALLASLAAAAPAEPAYILNGYSLSGLPGVPPEELLAKLPRKAGARITQADIVADQAIVAAVLKAHRIDGRLLTSIAEKQGRIWVIFDLAQSEEAPDLFERQGFSGNVRLSSEQLAAADGLRPGEPLTPARFDAARAAIVLAYRHATPARPVRLKAILRRRGNGRVLIEWVITEVK